jgi:carbon storage regulator
MLVLSRRVEESILIEPNIRIVVVRIGHGKVRIGIEAPENVEVRREELPPLHRTARHQDRMKFS